MQLNNGGGLDAVGTFERLRDAFFRYYDTPFGLADEQLQRERRNLLDRDGGVFRRPLLELRPQYRTTRRSLRQSAAEASAPQELDAFASAGLIPPGRELYTHQEEALALGMTPGRNVVITAGTGSGKTESFMLPILASLLEESRNWSGGPGPGNSWWEGDDPFMSQRDGETGRLAAVRAMVLYPMNALVDDQLIRMRKALDSDEARAWLDQHRRGHRFYFGRYTGATPVTGGRTDDRAVKDLRRFVRATEERGRKARELGGDTQFFVPRLDGAEMRSRWDMADAPPDILITNYSMLNVMLLRERDQRFFDSTRAWLQADDKHRFTLVVDELHTYRGTAGTEVALLIRNLKHRLALTETPEKLRILAASASLIPARDRLYLQEFFGLPEESFDFLEGENVRPASTTVDISHAAATLASTVMDGSAPLDAAEAAGAADALRNAFYKAKDGTDLQQPQAKTECELAETLFPAAKEEAGAALTALLQAVRQAGERNDWPKLRSHLFFRNVPGIWACTDPACPEIPEVPSEDRTVGRLFAEPATRCTCGARVLELLYCQNCGDVMLGGFVAEGSTQKDSVRALMLADVPELAKLPDQVLLERTAANYLMYWPRHKTPEVGALTWAADSNKVRYSFRRSVLDPSKGELRNVGQDQEYSGWSFHVTSPRKRTGEWQRDPARLLSLPTLCPNCGDDWEIKYGANGRLLPHTDPARQRSPIRGMRTGFEKINQVLVTELAEQLNHPERKLIVFTDSRQDAAKLSAGMGLRHYQDLLRLLLHQVVSDDGGVADLAAARRYVIERDRSPESYGAFTRLRAADRPTFERLCDIWEAAPGVDPAEEPQLVARLSAPPDLDTLAVKIESKLLAMGINPGGPHASLDATPSQLRMPGKRWPALYDWSGTVQPKAGLSSTERELLANIDAGLRKEVIAGLFSGAGRDFESLGLGWLALRTDTRPDALDPASPAALARSSLRVLADIRRFQGLRDPRDKPPAKLQKFWAEAASKLSTTEDSVRATVLAEWGNGVRDYLIAPSEAILRRPSGHAWTCTYCRRQHLHFGCGLCTRCRRPLPQAQSEVHHDEDYYAWKATNSLGRFRLNCAELTGQTDRVDAQSRQARFQEVFLDKAESVLADGVDLLSVTTTMEAGIDIGALEAVILGNMPPTRFNYQQRVGRAGRRNSPVAVALTVCRGRSHDEYYFERPELITNEPTPKPYLTLGRQEIFHRALRSEVLRMAFRDLGPSLASASLATDLTNNPHGQFGLSDEWPGIRHLIQKWLETHPGEIEGAATALATLAPASVRGQDWAARIATDLVADIDDALAGTTTGHPELSQRLAESGILPMFGFPTRVRYLHLSRPQHAYPWPPKGVIDRDIAMAVSQFAPLGEVVRDGSVHPVVGVAAFRPVRPKPLPEDDAMGIQRTVAVCRGCAFVEEPNIVGDDPPGPCPRCGAAPGIFQVVELREPLGFRAGFARDFDGNFSWSVRAMAARAMTDLDKLELVDRGGAVAYSGPGKRYVINDNGGRLFRFQPAVPGNTNWGGYVSVDAIERELVPPSFAAGDVMSVALGAVQPTDFLFLGPASPVMPAEGIRLNLDASARQPHGAAEAAEGRKAAWYSLAFLLRTVAATQLDVQQLELTAGVYSGVRDSQPTTFAFIADTLENGAGFSTHLGEDEPLAQLLDAADGYLQALSDPNHAAECSASCYRCLRDYSNMAYHTLLDWRLAGDLFGLLRGRHLADSRHREVAAIRKWAEGYHAETNLELPAPAALLDHPLHGRCVVIAKHPLEASERTLIAPRLADTLAELESAVPDADAIVFADTFLLDRDPGRAIAMFDEAGGPGQ